MPKFAANLSMLFTEHAFLDRFRAAADAGFPAVECQFPYDHSPDAIAKALSSNRLVLVLHNLPPGDRAGDVGLAAVPGREAEFRAAVEKGIRYATVLQCGQVNCLAGVASGPAARATLIENLKFAAERLATAGIRCLTEPLNSFDVPGFFLTSMEEAAEIVREAGVPNLQLQYDVYHRQRTAGDLIATYRRHQSLIAHIQVADAPCRHEPGSGEIDFPAFFAELDRAGYEGWVGCEYRPKGETLEGLAWLRTLAPATS